MEYCQLGKSNLQISRIGLGCWAFANDNQWGRIDENEAIRTVHMAIDRGVNYFDTAEGYGNGHSEEVLGRALQGKRDRVVVSTKTKNLSPLGLTDALDGSLRRLKTDYIDIYCLHWPSRDVPITRTIETLLKAKAQGKIRLVGVCNFGLGDLTDLLEHGRVEYNQLPYNLFWCMIEEGILQKCREESIGVVAYSPLAQGLLTDKFHSYRDIPAGHRHNARLYKRDILDLIFPLLDELREFEKTNGAAMGQIALAWVMAQPGVTGVIPGAKTRMQLEENLGACSIVLKQDEIEYLKSVGDPLRQRLGSDPDLWDRGRFN